MSGKSRRTNRFSRRGGGIVAVVAAVVVAGLAWIATPDGTDVSAPPTTPIPTSPISSSPISSSPISSPGEVGAARTQFDTARARVEELAVKGRAPKTGYSRDEFGPSWTDDVGAEFGHNGCDTRNDILRRDLTDITYKPDTRDCVVLSGVLDDPYSGRRIDFSRGEKTSPAVQIDHVVAMSDAWQKGAAQWDVGTRTTFANDPINLQATDGPTNSQKSNGDAATWLPPNKSYRCTYVARQVEVKARYALWVTAAEKEAMTGILAKC